MEIKYKLFYLTSVSKKDLPKIPKNIKAGIKKAIENRLAVDPLRFGDPLRRSLRGYRKLRVGDYRVIYLIEKNKIIIFKIDHRKEVYKKVES